jgi:hemolysin D
MKWSELWSQLKENSYWQALQDAWENRAQSGESKRNQQALEFLPSALEVLERPPSPIGKLLARTIIALFTIGVIWACVGEVDIVAVAEGKIVSKSRIKDIQPLEKGVVKAILVTEGERVKAGQSLVELDKTLTVAEQTRLTQDQRFTQLNWLRQSALLKALQGKVKKPILQETEEINLTTQERSMHAQLLQQEWLDYQSRVNTYLSQKNEREAALQSNQAKLQQLKLTLPLVTKRAGAMKKLVDKQMAPEMEYLKLEQERIEQEQTLITHQKQQQQFIAAVETSTQQLNTYKAEVIHQSLTKLDEHQRQINSLTQQLAKAKDSNAKQTLYAPVDGTVQQLAVHTVGGVVTEAQVLMKLVPRDDLEVEAVLENKDIGFVFKGQPAEIKINTFNFTKYGVIDAEVEDLTSDAIVDEQKGLIYKLRLKMEQTQMQIDGRTVDLLPGMAVIAEVKTGKRRLIEYVMSPLLRKMDESVRER